MASLLVMAGGLGLAGAEAQTVRVALFSNGSYVDASTSGISGELENVAAALALYDCTVTRFTAIDAASLAGVLSSADVLVIPELEAGDLAPALTDAAAEVISDFVDSGRGLIIFGQSGHNDVDVLNRVFGFGIVGGSTGGSFPITAEAVDTAFEGGPVSLPNNNGTYEWNSSSLPADSKRIYDNGTYTMVARVTYGSGKIVFLAYDWFDGYPRGTQDGGWHTVLGRALDEAGTPVAPLEIIPREPVVVFGYEGGPFTPTNTSFTLSNISASNLSWQAVPDPGADWMTLSATSGVLAAGGSTVIQGDLSSNAIVLAAGAYTNEITFLDTTSGLEQLRTVELLVYPIPEPPAVPHSPVPTNGAADVSYTTMLTWEHDNVVLNSPYVPDTRALYDVYFGTSAVSLERVATGLTNTVYDPGLLDISTTYYWQVIASNYVGSSTGAVWQFTTWPYGPLDHFDWAPITTNQLVGYSFPVSLTARDEQGFTVLDFTNSVDLFGYADASNGVTLFRESFEDATLEGWDIISGAPYANLTTNEYADGAQSLHLSGYTELHHTFEDSQPAEVELYVRNGTLGSEGVVLLGDLADFDTVPLYLYCYVGNLYTPGAVFGPYEIDRWYKVNFHLDWEAATYDFYVDDELVGSNVPFLGSMDSIEEVQIVNWSASALWIDGIHMTSGGGQFTSVTIAPTNTTGFVDGVWSGSVTVLEGATNMILRADAGDGRQGDSNPFTAHPPTLSILLPTGPTEGGESVAGEVVANIPPMTDLLVNLSSADTNEVLVDASVVIPAGSTNALFYLQAVDDAELDGTQYIEITATASNYVSGLELAPVFDNETAVLTLSMPLYTVEGAGTVDGSLLLDTPPVKDVVVALLSNNPDEIASGSVLVPAGQIFATFSLTVGDDAVLDGVQTATITAHVNNWTDSQASIFVYDNEVNALVVDVPASVDEDAGTLTAAGRVSIPGAAMHDVNIALSVSDAAQASVPFMVVIPAGQSNAVFDIDIIGNTDTDGSRSVAVVAQNPGYIAGLGNMEILDNDLHHIAVSALPAEVDVHQPVPVTIMASTIDGRTVSTFNSPVDLSASGDRGAVEVAPPVITNIVAGVGLATIAFEDIGNDVTMTLDAGGGIVGTSTVFSVLGAEIVITPPQLTNVLVIAGETGLTSFAISNTGNTALRYAVTDPSFAAHYPISGNAADESGNGHDGVVQDAVLIRDRFSNPDSAYRFNGDTSHIDLGALGGFKCVSMWVRQSLRSGYDTYFSHDDFSLFASIASSGSLVLSDGTSSISTTVQMDSHAGEWCHIVAISDGTNSAVYFNGSLVGSGTLGPVTTNEVNLGRAVGGTDHLNGDIDDVRVYNRLLSEEEIEVLYRETHLDENLIAYYPFDVNAIDASGNGLDGDATALTTTRDRFTTLGGASRFNGSSSFVQLPVGIVSGFSECSISTWVRLTQSAVWSRVFDFGSGTDVYMMLTPNSSSFTMRFAITTSGVGGEQVIEAPSLPLTAWRHIVVTLGDGVGRIYINGEVVGTNPGMTLTPASMGTTVFNYIGKSQWPDPYLNGRVDDFRIFDRVLSGTEIEALYTEGVYVLPELAEPWLAASPSSGTVTPGGSEDVAVTLTAAGLTAGDYTNDTLWIASSDAVSPRTGVPVSLWTLPPAPVMIDEPDLTVGTTNEVFWNPVAGPVEYQVEVADTTNAPSLEQSDWLSVSNHVFTALTTNTLYYYRARAAVNTAIGQLEGPWSGWISSMQISGTADTDGDGMADAWELMHFGSVGIADALTDSDGDGLSDLKEFIAGTDPASGVSYFTVYDVAATSNGNFVVYWDAVSGRVYSVHWTSGMTNAFGPLATGIPYPQSSYTDTVHGAESEGFYKVGVELE